MARWALHLVRPRKTFSRFLVYKVRLSRKQKSFFDCFGYLAMPGLLADCIGEIQTAFEEVWARRGANSGQKHDGTQRSMIVPFIDQHERLCALLDDERIERLVESLVGEDFNYVGSDGNYYVGNTQWHSDRWLSEVQFVKVAFYLDSLDRNTGCLRVMPGSHRLYDRYAQQINAEIGVGDQRWGIAADQVPAVSLENEPGDVVVFAHNVKHAAFGGDTRRRMFTINCCERVPPEHMSVLIECISAHVRYGIASMYDGIMLATAGPRRYTHLTQVLENQDHMPAELEKWQAESSV